MNSSERATILRKVHALAPSAMRREKERLELIATNTKRLQIITFLHKNEKAVEDLKKRERTSRRRYST